MKKTLPTATIRLKTVRFHTAELWSKSFDQKRVISTVSFEFNTPVGIRTLWYLWYF